MSRTSDRSIEGTGDIGPTDYSTILRHLAVMANRVDDKALHSATLLCSLLQVSCELVPTTFLVGLLCFLGSPWKAAVQDNKQEHAHAQKDKTACRSAEHTCSHRFLSELPNYMASRGLFRELSCHKSTVVPRLPSPDKTCAPAPAPRAWWPVTHMAAENNEKHNELNRRD